MAKAFDCEHQGGFVGAKGFFGQLFSLLVLVAATIGNSCASPYDEAIAAIRRGDVAGASRILRVFAEQESAEAQYIMGAASLAGKGSAKDYASAVRWFLKAAQQGDRNAAYSLGDMFVRGLGVARDASQAADWYRRAAEQGHSLAQASIGLMYAEAIGVDRNDIMAARWTFRAAQQGIAEAQLLVAKSIAAGKGVPKDNIAAYSWAAIAEARVTDHRLRDEAYGLRRSISSFMTSEQVARAKKIATEWRPELETPRQTFVGVSREQDGIEASLSVQRGEVVASWRFFKSPPAPLSAISGFIDGESLGVPRLEAYPAPSAKTSILLLLDVTDPGREPQIQQDKLTLADMAGHAQPHHQIDVGIYAGSLHLLVPEKADIQTLLTLMKVAPVRVAAANLAEALRTAIEVPSSTPFERRGIFVFTDGHSDDMLRADSLIENAKRARTSLNFIVTPSARAADVSVLEALATATGGLVVRPNQLAEFLQSPFQLVDSGATARFPIGHLRRGSQADPEARVAFQYGDRVLELRSGVANEARTERHALERVLSSCDDCSDDFKQQVRDRLTLIIFEETTYVAAQDDPERLREYVSECRACSFREEAETRAKAIEEVVLRKKSVQEAALVQPEVQVAPCEISKAPAGVSLSSWCLTRLSPNEEGKLKPLDSFQECYNCPDMVVMPSGSFTMGSPEGETNRQAQEGPQHVVTIGRRFAVGKFPITKNQFAAFVADTHYDAGSKCWTGERGKIEERTDRSWRNPGFKQDGSHPAVCLSWKDAKAYVDWLAAKTHREYRLLTEAEWEYAARARTEPGSYPRYWFGDDDKDLCRSGNVADQTVRDLIPRILGVSSFYMRNLLSPCSDGYAYTSPVGHFSANAFGLHDMVGNAEQWTADCWHENYVGALSDGSVWASGDCSRRVVRGGSWLGLISLLRAASRGGQTADLRDSLRGFRVARTISP